MKQLLKTPRYKKLLDDLTERRIGKMNPNQGSLVELPIADISVDVLKNENEQGNQSLDEPYLDTCSVNSSA